MAKAVKKNTHGNSKKPSNAKQQKSKGGVKKTAAVAAVKKVAAKKKTEKPKLEKGVDGVIEYEELGNIDSWDWNETGGTDTFLTDDAGGFLCLEEISDVEIEYEGDDTTGKVAKFKVRFELYNKKWLA
jgi:hypothetical protein